MVWRAVKTLFVVIVAVAIAALIYVALRIEHQSNVDEAHAADAIVVMGAAEYNGSPSPVLKSRLDHALELYRQKLAPRIITTGGAGGDPQYTEGEVGRAYLTKQGVPSEDILVEPEGETTVQSIAGAAEIMRRLGLRSCIVVSDGYHIYRSKRMLQAKGYKVYGSPRHSREKSDLEEWWLYLKQAAGYLLWRAGIPV